MTYYIEIGRPAGTVVHFQMPRFRSPRAMPLADALYRWPPGRRYGAIAVIFLAWAAIASTGQMPILPQCL